MVCSVLGEQPFWARVVARHGAGTRARFRTLTTATLQRGLETLLRDDVVARARALGEQMRAERPGTDVAADVIERVLEGRQRPGGDAALRLAQNASAFDFFCGAPPPAPRS
jgi:UDP:flavonoid glycosyltransferase YjiC (YdhE family)